MEKYIINGVEVEYDTFDLDNMDVFDKGEQSVKKAAFDLQNDESGNTMQKIRDFVDCILDFFDDVLGEGAATKVFGEKQNLRDISKGYIAFHDEVMKKMKEELPESKPETTNREQRRSAARNRQ